MSDTVVQWIVVGAIVALCVWRAIGYVRSYRRGGCSCGCGEAPEDGKGRDCKGGCNGCPLADCCKK